MKTICLMALAATLVSCSKYQYAVIESTVKKGDQGILVMENDTVQITYKFGGLNGPSVVALFNKLDVPLYVNWQRSAVIIDNKSISRASDVSNISATAMGTEVQLAGNVSSSYSSIDGSISHSPYIGFVPPGTYVESPPIYLKSKFFSVDKRQMKRTYLNGMKSLYQEFDEQESPFTFRSFITISLNPNFETPVFFDERFWVGAVTETAIRPAERMLYNGRRDTFHVSEITDFGVFMGTMVVIGSVGLLLAWGNAQ